MGERRVRFPQEPLESKNSLKGEFFLCLEVSNIGLVVALSTLDRKCVKQKCDSIFVAFTNKG
jgi:hypothetical protein